MPPGSPIDEGLAASRQAAPDGSADTPGRRPRPSRGLVLGALAVAAVLAAGIAVLLLTHSPQVRRALHLPTPSAASPSPEPRVVFRFPDPRVIATGFTGKTSSASARRAAGAVRTVLSGFYDQAFVAPAAWRGSDGTAWRSFAAASAKQARRSARSLTLGRVAGLERMRVTKSALTVRVLLDPSQRPQAVFGTVLFRATGTRVDGSTVNVRNDAIFLLRPIAGRWAITAFPSARTTIDSAPAPAPTPAAGPSAGPSAAESPS